MTRATLTDAIRRPLITNLTKDLLRRTAGAAMGRDPVRFVIFTNGRTGSNLIVSLLKEHPEVRVHSEIFGEYQLEDRANRRRINRIGPVAYYRRALRPLAAERAVGLKILTYQLDRDYGEVRGIPGVEAVREAIRADGELRFIHHMRRDLLGRLVSNRLAAASGRWERGAYGADPIHIDAAWALEELDRMVENDAELRRALPEDRTVRTYYETLVDAPQATMDAIYALLGLPSRPATVRTRKQNTRPHSQSIVNFDELKEALSGTRHAGIFTEPAA